MVGRFEPGLGCDCSALCYHVMTMDAGKLALLKSIAASQISTGASPLDLELHVRELPDGRLETTLVYATDLFDPSTAQRMSNHFMVCS